MVHSLWLTVEHSCQVHIESREGGLHRLSLIICQKVTFFRNPRVGNNDINVTEFLESLVESSFLIIPLRDIASLKGECGVWEVLAK